MLISTVIASFSIVIDHVHDHCFGLESLKQCTCQNEEYAINPVLYIYIVIRNRYSNQIMNIYQAYLIWGD